MQRRTPERIAAATIAGTGLLAIGLTSVVLVGDSAAELDPKECAPHSQAQVYTSRAEQLRIVIPRGWCATDHASYPGVLAWMMRSEPPGKIALTSEAFTREMYCSWPATCRNLTTNTARYACALRERLVRQRMRVNPTQLGPKENELAGLPSVWFEYDDGSRFLRHAVTVTDDRAISLVLAAASAETRAAHVRSFDQALRSLQPLAAEVAPILDAAPPATTTALDGGVLDGAPRPPDAAPLDAGVVFQSAPARHQTPVGPCPK